MKKLILLSAIGLTALVSCTKDTNLYAPAQPTMEEIMANLEERFGILFDANQDWKTTVNGSVKITANAALSDIAKVQILTLPPFGNGDGNGSTILNEADATAGQTIELYYDAPKANERLYAACVSKSGEYYIKSFAVGQESVTFAHTANARMTRSSSPIFDMVATLPQQPKLSESVTSYAKQRNYAGFQNDALYTMSDEDEALQMMNIEAYNYTDEEKTDLVNIVFSYLPNKGTNIQKIRGSVYYNATSYPITTGEDPIVLEPIYKDDGGYDEVEYCHLYYYYFKDEDLVGKTEAEQVQFFKDLPKYRAFWMYPIVHNGGEDKGMPNKVLNKKMAYALIYWGEGQPVLGETVGTYQFPAGYRLGFMLRNADKHDEHHGELYCDGRLNGEVNKWKHLASAKLGETDARMAWLTANGKTLLCCESGTDSDFNDLVIEIEGGVDPLVVVPTVEANSYSYCFEDTYLGDYDLNDVVITAKRLKDTQVEYSIVASGAQDEIYIKNINAGAIVDGAEVHSLFGVGTGTFINTVEGEKYYQPVTVKKTVAKGFSFTDPQTQPYLYNKTKDQTTYIAKKGEDPHGIMVPFDFKYPKEYVCIKNAYSEFNSWGQNAVNSLEWYKNPNENQVYNKAQ